MLDPHIEKKYHVMLGKKCVKDGTKLTAKSDVSFLSAKWILLEPHIYIEMYDFDQEGYTVRDIEIARQLKNFKNQYGSDVYVSKWTDDKHKIRTTYMVHFSSAIVAGIKFRDLLEFPKCGFKVDELYGSLVVINRFNHPDSKKIKTTMKQLKRKSRAEAKHVIANIKYGVVYP